MPTLKTRIIYSCCFGYHVLRTDKKKHAHSTIRFFSFFLRYCVGVKAVT